MLFSNLIFSQELSAISLKALSMCSKCLQYVLLVTDIKNIFRACILILRFSLFEKKKNLHESIRRQHFPLMNISSFFFSTAKYFCSLFATDAYDKKLNYCSSFQYAFLRGSLRKNKHLKRVQKV